MGTIDAPPVYHLEKSHTKPWVLNNCYTLLCCSDWAGSTGSNWVGNEGQSSCIMPCAWPITPPTWTGLHYIHREIDNLNLSILNIRLQYLQYSVESSVAKLEGVQSTKFCREPYLSMQGAPPPPIQSQGSASVLLHLTGMSGREGPLVYCDETSCKT